MATFIGSAEADIFTGGAENDSARGNGGDDQLSGGGGNDELAGGAGADTIDGGDGEDTLFSGEYTNFSRYQISPPPVLDTGSEIDTLRGGAGDDRIFAGYGDNVDGGTQGQWSSSADILLISFVAAPTGITADFRSATLVIGGATITGIEAYSWVEGSNFDDDLTMNHHSDSTYLFGLAGNDRLTAGYYTRLLSGGDGNDFVDGRQSGYLDRVEGGAGNDILYTPTNSFAAAYGGDGDDTIYSHGFTFGGNGNDLIILSWSYYGGAVHGDAGDDEIRASSAGHIMFGGSGADILIGNTGSDTLASAEAIPNSNTAADDAGLERDILSAGGGNDRLSAGYGDDADGGEGTDALRLSLAGATAGLIFSSAGLVGTGPFVFGGGTIKNIETFEYLRASEFGDWINIATQPGLLTVEAGGGDDLLISNSSSVHFKGGAGNDRFINGIAGDVQDGGDGTDTVDYANAGGGVVVKLGLLTGQAGTGPGGDQLYRIENLDGSAFGDQLEGSNDANVLNGRGGDDVLKGMDGNDVLIGDEGADVLEGGAGNDLLNGGAGADQLNGGAGNDFYLIEGADVIVEAAGGGFDIVSVQGSYQLAAGVEIEMLVSGFEAGTAALTFVGNGFGQVIRANAGNNVINGLGGADTMIGLAGDDYYIVDGDDAVYEAAGGGFDVVATHASHTLAGGSEVEMLVTSDQGATVAMNLIGNGFGQIIQGNAGNNLINGGGGVDVLSGFGGDDYYVVDGDDLVFESAGRGFDIVASHTSITLTGGSHIEMLVTSNEAGTAGLILVGNELGQIIRGNAGGNIINGGGGADLLAGLGGNDYYVVDGDDGVAESASGGFDIVASFGSFTLGRGSEVEMLVTTDEGGSASVTLAGNEFGQTIRGNAGDNVIDGKGGADVLSGLSGSDTFAFTTALGGGDVARILDFAAGTDRIALDDAVFTGLGLGSLGAAAFRTGTSAQDTDDRIIYDQETGALWFDADGSGAGAAVQFAALQAGLNLSAGDFFVI